MDPISPRFTSKRVGIEEGIASKTFRRVVTPRLGPKASKKAAFGLYAAAWDANMNQGFGE